MVWCPNCVRDCPADRDHDSGYTCCTECGRVHFQDLFAEYPTFVKGPGGESRLAGKFVRSVQSEYSESFRRTLEKGSNHITDLMHKLNLLDDIGPQATAFYRIALERSFTKGRITTHVAASCLYIACRMKSKPFLLIDFAILLSVNVYVLGAVYLQLCKLLSLEEHPIVQKPVDPSLFMHRYTNVLMKGDYKSCVSKRALQIVASMKRDWMQTGRKPGGICGAALYISALSYGFRYSRSDVVKVVHICEATLSKRLVEFETTDSASLTIEELECKAKEIEEENRSCKLPDTMPRDFVTKEVFCQHKGKEPHFAHGLCRSCYAEFIELSGGLMGGSDPPAFQNSEKERLAKPSVQEGEFTSEESRDNGKGNTMADSHASAATDNGGDTSQKFANMPSVDDETSTDSLSDIDDAEMNGYIHTEEESRKKRIIWEELNKEYIQEQAAKEAAAAALKNLDGLSDDVQAAYELAAAAAAAVAKSREKRRQKRAAEAKTAGPAQTAAEATRKMLQKKRLSSKINFDVLETLFDDDNPPAKESKLETKLQEDEADTVHKSCKEKQCESQEDEECYREDMFYHDEYNDCDYTNEDDF
ncbi:transcription factor IIIB 60 kDa subunit-like isoform X1 [Ipomoea triloba]|uniref:transcription factor IIIB 60 kDa subunit-like isoform X1 n=1 Tax=Ipomoea triloba TaxID=35885 RepID=UPI00125CE9DC|nr:transcription factor IIIB 60 kDa subunit-like isoform X1 [Ipomoea triloba]XP_031125977.1 transcription factor IIIB 60 kDa subunit-like isoform X1 [Ipomoea triloba]